MDKRRSRNRRTFSFRFGQEGLETRLCLDSTVVFNEVMYHPAEVEDGAGEWIELYNQLAVDMDISDWILSDAVDYEFPDGTIVLGRGYLVVAAHPPTLAEATGLEGILGPWSGRLSNAGEELRLYNNDGRLMNVFNYKDTAPWPAAPDGGGASLVKADPATASHRQESWTFSRQVGGTPGRSNSADMSLPESLVINEMAASSAAAGAFFVEVANAGNQAFDLAGITIATSNNDLTAFRFSAGQIAPGELFSLDETRLGFRPQDTDRVMLHTADGQAILDGQRVSTLR